MTALTNWRVSRTLRRYRTVSRYRALHSTRTGRYARRTILLPLLSGGRDLLRDLFLRALRLRERQCHAIPDARKPFFRPLHVPHCLVPL
eukprot:2049550-Rhodomonas_salina.1